MQYYCLGRAGAALVQRLLGASVGAITFVQFLMVPGADKYVGFVVVAGHVRV